MITKNNIHDIAIRVNNGSGILVHLTEGYFVITARHCLNDTNELKNFNSKCTYETGEVYYHKNKKDNDIALIEVTNINFVIQSTISKEINVDDKIKAYGFPYKGDQDGMPLSGKVIKWHETKSIETELGGQKSEKWGPRNIDIDILYCDDMILQSEELTILSQSARVQFALNNWHPIVLYRRWV